VLYALTFAPNAKNAKCQISKEPMLCMHGFLFSFST
jgi:hypothetical protein